LFLFVHKKKPFVFSCSGGEALMETRYSFGGDEHLFAEIDEEMSLAAFFKSFAMTNAVRESRIKGVTEICPANASLMVRFDPDMIAPDYLLAELKALEAQADKAEPRLKTRIIEVPVFYNDPWTRETLMRFRERHQDPTSTDLEYGAGSNGYDSIDAFIAAHAGAPWFVPMVGFVAGVPWLYQMVAREKQIQVPKYLRPRTDTPKLTIGHGGCFGCIYSVRGAGGYQMFGITPMPIYDPQQKISYLREFMIFFKPGDMVQFKPIDRTGYEQIEDDVAQGRFEPRIRPVTFVLAAFNENPAGYARELTEALSDD
jgi:urea carboxylase